MRPLWSGLMVLALRTASTMRLLAGADASPLILAGSATSWSRRLLLLIESMTSLQLTNESWSRKA